MTGTSQAQACFPLPSSLGTDALMHKYPAALAQNSSHPHSSVYYFHVRTCVVRGERKKRPAGGLRVWGVVEVKLEAVFSHVFIDSRCKDCERTIEKKTYLFLYAIFVIKPKILKSKLMEIVAICIHFA